MANVNTFFHGEMSAYHIFCLKTFADYGHHVIVYCYDGTWIPDFCHRGVAEEILSKDKIFFVEDGGSIACFADWFRYELLYQQGGWWIDTDVICLREYWSEEKDTIIAWESLEFVNIAVMKWTVADPLLRDAADTCARIKEKVFWGQTGPRYMTHLLKESNRISVVCEAARYYPVSHKDWRNLFDPYMFDAVNDCSKQSDGLHIWWEMCRRGGINPNVLPPLGSYLRGIIDKHDAINLFRA